MPQPNPFQTMLENALKEALEACLLAENYATSRGMSIKFSSADVTAIGLAIYSAMQGGKHA